MRMRENLSTYKRSFDYQMETIQVGGHTVA